MIRSRYMHVYMYETHYEWLSKRAHDEGITKSQLLRDMINKEIETERHAVLNQEERERRGQYRDNRHYDRDGYCDNPARGY